MNNIPDAREMVQDRLPEAGEKGCEGCVHSWYIQGDGVFGYTGPVECMNCTRFPERKDHYTPKGEEGVQVFYRRPW